MGLKAYKPTTSGRRGMTIVTTEELTKKRPEKSLTSFLLRTGGRNNDGRTTVRFRGAGHRRLYRTIDFRRDKVGISAKVSALEYDPNRSARIALLTYRDGEKRYILAPIGLQVGMNEKTYRIAAFPQCGHFLRQQRLNQYAVEIEFHAQTSLTRAKARSGITIVPARTMS